MRDATEGAELDVRQVLSVLYPGADRIVLHSGTTRNDFVALPSARDPRLLLPADRKYAAAALGYSRRVLSRRSAILTGLARIALRTGVPQLMVNGIEIGPNSDGSDSIERHLQEVLGRKVTIGVLLGPPRANRKPVLQVMDEQRRLIAVAKIGLTGLTRRLAEREAFALSSLREKSPRTFQIADLVSMREWNGVSVLVQSGLDLASTQVAIDGQLRYDAMTELAGINGTYRAALSTSPYWYRLWHRIRELGTDAPAECVRRIYLSMAESMREITFGTWHGDWTAWNMLIRDGRAYVWDWERYETDVPVGFDALHFEFMSLLRTTESDAGSNLISRASDLLRPFKLGGQDSETVATLYLLDLAARYLHDGQAEIGVAGGDIRRWLEPVACGLPAEGVG